MTEQLSVLEQLHTLLEISRKIATEPESDSLFQTILESAVALAEAEGGTIFFYEEASESLVFKFVISSDPEVARRLQGKKLARGVGIVGKVADTFQTDLATDTDKDPRFTSQFDRLSGFHTRSVLTVPLQFFDHSTQARTLVGVLQLVNKRRGNFTRDDAEKVEAYGGFAASLLTRAKLHERLRRQYLGTIASLAEAVDAKDPYTHGHSLRVAAYCVALGEVCAFPPLRLFNVRVSALLHDIGKIGIPDAILQKKDKLNDAEFERIKSHITEAARILRPANLNAEVYDGILYHHEKWDGSGYPEQRRGEDIPMFGRIVAFADAFDTITTERPYKKSQTFAQGRQIIRDAAGAHFDPNLAPRFCGLSLEDIAARGAQDIFVDETAQA